MRLRPKKPYKKPTKPIRSIVSTRFTKLVVSMRPHIRSRRPHIRPHMRSRSKRSHIKYIVFKRLTRPVVLLPSLDIALILAIKPIWLIAQGK